MSQVLLACNKEERDLYDGTGEPCAGHVKLNESNRSRVRLVILVSSENLGLDPPIGSKKCKTLATQQT